MNIIFASHISTFCNFFSEINNLITFHDNKRAEYILEYFTKKK